jgi:hypothetical protein
VRRRKASHDRRVGSPWAEQYRDHPRIGQVQRGSEAYGILLVDASRHCGYRWLRRIDAEVRDAVANRVFGEADRAAKKAPADVALVAPFDRGDEPRLFVTRNAPQRIDQRNEHVSSATAAAHPR